MTVRELLQTCATKPEVSVVKHIYRKDGTISKEALISPWDSLFSAKDDILERNYEWLDEKVYEWKHVGLNDLYIKLIKVE